MPVGRSAVYEVVSACEGEAVVCKCGFVYVVWETVCKGSPLERVYLRVSIWPVPRSLGVIWECVCVCVTSTYGKVCGCLNIPACE